MQWPNRFSSILGDKAYGLLMANLAGVPVPRTLVIGRRIAPFTFGDVTGSFEFWTRTCQ
jgi:glutathione synthase/RimK-type ligase-like ATP-grasp enzyme